MSDTFRSAANIYFILLFIVYDFHWAFWTIVYLKFSENTNLSSFYVKYLQPFVLQIGYFCLNFRLSKFV